MVDFQRVLGELKRTAYVGTGTWASASVGGFLDEMAPDGVGDVAISSGQALAGSVAAHLVDERMGVDETQGMTVDFGEAAYHASHGVGGAGFAEMVDLVTEGQTSGSSNDVVEVTTRSHASRSVDNDGRSAREEEKFMADVG